MIKSLSPIFKQNDDAKEVNKAILGAVEDALNTATTDTDLTKNEMTLTKSSGSWLDTIWGTWFGITRIIGESDGSYSNRVISTTTFPKVTINAIITAVNKIAGYTGGLTRIYEPFNNIAKHDISTFSGSDRYENGNYWLTATFDLITPYPITDSIRQAVNEMKAAGVRVFYTCDETIDLSAISNETFDVIGSEVLVSVENQVINPYQGASFDQYNDLRKRSGEQETWFDDSAEIAGAVFLSGAMRSSSSIGINPDEGMTLPIVLPFDFHKYIWIL